MTAETEIRLMNAFTAVIPDHRAGFGPSFDVNLYLDPEGDAWIAESDALPLATEAATLDALVQRVWEIAPEIAELNGHRGKLRLRFILQTAARG
jgi:hypothetical protein